MDWNTYNKKSLPYDAGRHHSWKTFWQGFTPFEINFTTSTFIRRSVNEGGPSPSAAFPCLPAGRR
jgi:hypothetical protein